MSWIDEKDTIPCDDTSVDASLKRLIKLFKIVSEDSEGTVNRQFSIGASRLSLLKRLVLLNKQISERKRGN